MKASSLTVLRCVFITDPKGTNTVIVLPIGIGQLGKDTPINWTTKS